MTLSIYACLLSLVALIVMLRSDRISLGLPVAYLFSLLLIHVPGAVAHLAGGEFLGESHYTETGIEFTAIGSICFVAGVWLARQGRLPAVSTTAASRHSFFLFCLIAGWLVTYAFSLIRGVPSLAAAVDKGGAAWMLGVMLGLRAAIRRSDAKWTAIWIVSLMVYPVLILLLGGFLSYGSAAIIVVLAVLAVSTRSHLRVAAGLLLASLLAPNLFLSYFENRDEIRNAVWGGAPMEERIDAAASIFSDFAWFDPQNNTHLVSLDKRLNQNYFVGVAADRLEAGQVEYLRGQSFVEGAMALVPRAIWPDKPVYGGSPKIVSEMTGLVLSDTTSWGVGNVMEFHVNFGVPGLILGFVGLGWLLAFLDRRAAFMEAHGHLGQTFIYFLPAAALIQPNGSLVEVIGGAAAALVAAYAWRAAWRAWDTVHAPPISRVPALMDRRA